MYKYDTNSKRVPLPAGVLLHLNPLPKRIPLPAGALFHPVPLPKRVTLPAGVLLQPGPCQQINLLLYSLPDCGKSSQA